MKAIKESETHRDICLYTKFQDNIAESLDYMDELIAEVDVTKRKVMNDVMPYCFNGLNLTVIQSFDLLSDALMNAKDEQGEQLRQVTEELNLLRNEVQQLK